MELFNYFKNNMGYIISLLFEHLKLTMISVLIAIFIGVPIGILINRYTKLEKSVLGGVNIIQAIPSLALLGFFIPFLGIGMKPAIVVVILYSLLPIIKNTYIGLKNINPQTLEAARGIGMTKMQVLTKIRIPLALPVIMGGVRIAAVTAVGLMTIAAYIGAGGLGDLVYAGIATVNNSQILAGAIPACILALLIDFVLSRVENMVTPLSMRTGAVINKKTIKRRKTNIIIVGSVSVGLVIVLILTSIVSSIKTSGTKTIVIASKEYTEQRIVAHLISDLVEEYTDISVDRKMGLGGTGICLEGMKTGEIDAMVEYTGTAYLSVLNMSGEKDPDAMFDIVEKEYGEQFGIKWLNPFGYNNTYSLTITPELSESKGIYTISDLKRHSNNLTLACTREFSVREDGWVGLSAKYDMDFGDIKIVESSMRYTAQDNGEADVIDAFTTDGLIANYNLVVLEDDLGFFSPYYAAPIVRTETLEKYPELEDALSKLDGVIQEDVMVELNYKVDKLGMEPSFVAREYLKSINLIN